MPGVHAWPATPHKTATHSTSSDQGVDESKVLMTARTQKAHSWALTAQEPKNMHELCLKTKGMNVEHPMSISKASEEKSQHARQPGREVAMLVSVSMYMTQHQLASESRKNSN